MDAAAIAPTRPVRHAHWAMATRFELLLATARGDTAALAEAAFDAIDECEQRLSLFQRGSLLTHVNANAGARWVSVDADTFALLERCAAVHDASRGAFDPTIAGAMTALGLHSGATTPRAAADRAAAGAAAGMRALRLDPQRGAVRFVHPGIALDLGGIGKGHGVDLATAALAECGVETFLLHGGCSAVMARGAPPGGDAWRVATHPAAGAPHARLRDRALAVSSADGRRHAGTPDLHHLLHPASGRPAGFGGTVAVTAAEAALADAWATALAVHGALLPLPPGVHAVLRHADGTLEPSPDADADFELP